LLNTSRENQTTGESNFLTGLLRPGGEQRRAISLRGVFCTINVLPSPPKHSAAGGAWSHILELPPIGVAVFVTDVPAGRDATST
jgi:hypothetical protein